MSDNDSMRKSQDENRSEKVTIRIQPSLLKLIKAEADRDRRSVADVITFALEARFERRGRARATKGRS